MVYSLGIAPDTLEVRLYRDADFDSDLTRTSDTSPPTEVAWGTDDVYLLFSPGTDDEARWDATVDGATATFAIDKAVTNARLAKEPVELWVGEQCWAVGKSVRKGVPRT